jgi:hypothetical protein
MSRRTASLKPIAGGLSNSILYLLMPREKTTRIKHKRHWHGEPYELIGELFVAFMRAQYKQSKEFRKWGNIARMAEYIGVSPQAMQAALRGSTKTYGTYRQVKGSTDAAPIRPRNKKAR